MFDPTTYAGPTVLAGQVKGKLKKGGFLRYVSVRGIVFVYELLEDETGSTPLNGLLTLSGVAGLRPGVVYLYRDSVALCEYFRPGDGASSSVYVARDNGQPCPFPNPMAAFVDQQAHVVESGHRGTCAVCKASEGERERARERASSQ